jgi:hypothetical protein
VADGARTHDNRNHNPGLYQLSYSHHCITTKLNCYVLQDSCALYKIRAQLANQIKRELRLLSGRGFRLQCRDRRVQVQQLYKGMDQCIAAAGGKSLQRACRFRQSLQAALLQQPLQLA